MRGKKKGQNYLTQAEISSDPFSFTPDEFRTVANGGIDFSPLRSTNNGLGHGMSDSGYLALRLTFTDFSTAIYRVRLAQVPEPSSTLLAMLAGAATALRRSRRTCECRLVCD
jgi:hypothetical protein